MTVKPVARRRSGCMLGIIRELRPSLDLAHMLMSSMC